MKEAIFGSKYWRAALICFIINFFNQYAGVTPILMFTGTLLKKFAEEAEGENGSEFPITPVAGGIIIGTLSAIATVIALFLVKCNFGRKTLFLIGQVGVTIPLFSAGYCLK